MKTASYKVFSDMLCVTRLIAGLTSPRPRFDPSAVEVNFVMDTVGLPQGLSPVLQFSHVSIIP